jgi:GT2 family glycosyltransferase
VTLPSGGDGQVSAFEGQSSAETLSSVSVIICTYAEFRWKDLTTALFSVRTQSRAADQIILVIDHNPLLYKKASVSFPDISVIENAEQRGLAGARNTGIANCTCDVIAFLDDDAVAESNWLEELTRPFGDSRIMGTGGAAYPDWLGHKPPWFPREFYWVIGCSYRGLPEVIGPIRNPIGAAMAFRRSVFSEVGYFDRQMGRVAGVPLGCEETVLGIRVGQHFGKGNILYVPTAVVAHKVGPERANLGYFIKRCFAEGISKAAVAHLVGKADGSSVERRYVTRILPSGFKAGLRRFAAGDVAGVAASSLIILGLLATSFGYGVGRLGFGTSITRWLIQPHWEHEPHPDD